jgi:hypothetical protein
VRVLFLVPQSSANPNALATTSSSVITTAGAVARIVDPGVEQTASDDVTLAGEGVRHGFAVRLPNNGGQWATNFDRPELEVQAVGSSAAEVNATMNGVLREIRTTLQNLQASRRVAPHNMITVSQSPPTVPLYYQTGSPVRALAATLLLGVGLSLAAAGLARRLERRRRRRRLIANLVAEEPPGTT